PAGLITANMPGEDRESLFDQVKTHVKGGKRKPVRAWIIHRLDKEASGLLVFAKTEKAFQWLKEDLRQRRMHRLYLAVVEGESSAAGAADPGARHAKPKAPVVEDRDGTLKPGGSATPTRIPRTKQQPSGTI